MDHFSVAQLLNWAYVVFIMQCAKSYNFVLTADFVAAAYMLVILFLVFIFIFQDSFMTTFVMLQ